MVVTWKQLVATISIALLLFTACSTGVKYAVRGEHKTDGELMESALSNASENIATNGTLDEYKIVTVSDLDGDPEDALLKAAADVINSKLLGGHQEGETDAAVKYRVMECQIKYYHAGGMTRRVATARYHVRLEEPEDNNLLWAGDFSGEAEDKVPNGLAKKLVDTRFTQIGQEFEEEESANPIIEPILVVGITGALIYLFTVTAK